MKFLEKFQKRAMLGDIVQHENLIWIPECKMYTETINSYEKNTSCMMLVKLISV